MNSDRATLTPGMRVLCRDAERLVTRVEPSDQAGHHLAVHCVGTDDLVRGNEAVLLTQLDHVQPVSPAQTELVEDTSPGYRLPIGTSVIVFFHSETR